MLQNNETGEKRGTTPPNNGSPSDAGVAELSALPGMGPIRARALKKAGFDNVAALRGATLEQLAAVPGITPLKAQQILDQVSGEPQAVATPPLRIESAAVTKKRRSPAAPKKPATARPAAPADSRNETGRRKTPPPATQVSPAMRIAEAAQAVLNAPHSDSFDRPLARQIGKVAALTGRIAIRPVDDNRQPSPQLAKIGAILSELLTGGAPGAKKQEKIAEELRERRRKLQRDLGLDDDADKKSNV